MSAERRIICTDEEVRGLLERRRTQLRRPISNASGAFWDHAGYRLAMCPSGAWRFFARRSDEPAPGSPVVHCPFGVPGDVLSVREAWATSQDYDRVPLRSAGFYERDMVWYRAAAPGHGHGRWRSPVTMPAWAVRLRPVVVAVRAQRLQEISEEDALAEGMLYHDGDGIGHSGWVWALTVELPS